MPRKRLDVNKAYLGKARIVHAGGEKPRRVQLLKKLPSGNHNIGHGFFVNVEGNTYTVHHAGSVVGSSVLPKK